MFQRFLVRPALALAVVLASACGSAGDPTQCAGQKPIALAGNDRTVAVGSTVYLSGRSENVVPVDFEWKLVSVPDGSAARLQDEWLVNPSFVPDLPGLYVASLVVSDGCAQSEPDAVTFEATGEVQNGRPIANAGSDRMVSRGTLVQLSGAESYDPEGSPLTFDWSMVVRPAGSSAQLGAATTMATSFTADVEGEYRVQLLVSDGRLTSVASSVTITVGNTVPTASTAATVATVVGQEVALDGTASDAEGDALTYTWKIVERPAGSAAALSNAASEDPRFVADVEGMYLLTFSVSDGVNQSTPISVTVTAYRPIHLLTHRVVDAEYSRALDRVVMVAESPSALYIFDPVAKTETAVALPAVPTSVSVSPDGTHAAVGHNAYVSYVDLVNAQRVRTLPIACDVGDVVLGGNGFAYAFPRVDQWVEIHSLNLTTGAETLSGGWSIRAGTLARLHPDGVRMYGANNGLSPSDIERYSIDANGTAQYAWDSPYHGDYPMCGDLWFSEDGARIFTRCGRVFRTAASSTDDMKYAGALSGADYITSLSHSAAAGSVAVTLGATYSGSQDAKRKLLFFEDAFLAVDHAVLLPLYVRNAKGYNSYGRFVFFNAAGDKAFAIVQVDPSSSLLNEFGIVTY